jgi:hypothetical protein
MENVYFSLTYSEFCSLYFASYTSGSSLSSLQHSQLVLVDSLFSGKFSPGQKCRDETFHHAHR